MKDNFEACLKEVLRHEGGWADNPADPGGATMKGVTLKTYRAWTGRQATKAELRAITDEEVSSIYRAWYWQPVRGDDLPAGLDLVAFDAAVNSGPSRGAQWLQAAVGAVQDGKVGPETIEAARRANKSKAINAACEARLAAMRTFKDAQGRPAWDTFGKGWSSRVESVRQVALDMSRGIPVLDAEPQSPVTYTSKPLVALLAISAIIAAAAWLFLKG